MCSLSVVSDFDLMMKRQKEENQRMRRKRRDVDMINDNDDLIAEMIARMKQAAEVGLWCVVLVLLS